MFLVAKASPSAGEFQDVEGETEERRRARLERHQRTQERAVCVLCPKTYLIRSSLLPKQNRLLLKHG